MQIPEINESERSTELIELADAERAVARKRAAERHEENGTDEHTRDPENILNGRERGMAAEMAFVRWADETFGSENVEYTDLEGGNKEPYDVEINGVKIDIQARNDARDYDSYALLKSKRLAQSKRGDAAPDIYVAVVTNNELRSHVIYGWTETKRLHNPQQIAGPWYGFNEPTYYMDDKSPYFKDADALKDRLAADEIKA